MYGLGPAQLRASGDLWPWVSLESCVKSPPFFGATFVPALPFPVLLHTAHPYGIRPFRPGPRWYRPATSPLIARINKLSDSPEIYDDRPSSQGLLSPGPLDTPASIKGSFLQRANHWICQTITRFSIFHYRGSELGISSEGGGPVTEGNEFESPTCDRPAISWGARGT